MSAKGTKSKYLARIEPETLPALQDLAAALGFFADVPGRHYGDPSPPALLDALAAAYTKNPTAVAAALRALGIVGDGPPPERG